MGSHLTALPVCRLSIRATHTSAVCQPSMMEVKGLKERRTGIEKGVRSEENEEEEWRTSIAHDHARDANGGVGGHLQGPEAAALVAFGAELGGAI